MTISMLLEMAVAGYDGRPAVRSSEKHVRYDELAELASGAAVLARAEGARSLAFVGTNGLAVPIALYGAAYAGIPFVPLNYRLTAAQLADLLAQLDSPMVVAEPQYLEFLREAGWPAYDSELWLADCAANTSTEPVVEVDDDSPAVILFTSGTTANPKGVVLRHDHLASYVLQTVDFGAAEDRDAALISVPPYHVAGIGTVLTNIYAGRMLVYLSDFTPAGWLATIRQHAVTQAMVVPTMLARIADAVEAGACVADVPSLRSIAYGGSRMPAAVLERALRIFPEVGFVNAYGLTETSSTIAVLGPDDHRAALASDVAAVRARLASAGRPVPGVEIEIRDIGGAVLTDGSPGELWVRGPQVSGHYLGRGSVLDENGWFGTKDQAWVDAEGYLFIEGRTDDTIIRGGENISPAEVEDVLGAHPGVRDVAVLGVPDDEWGQRLVAVVVSVPGEVEGLGDLREWVRSRVRGSRTPDEIHYRSELPYTPTGKLLRRQLVDELIRVDALPTLTNGGQP